MNRNCRQLQFDGSLTKERLVAYRYVAMRQAAIIAGLITVLALGFLWVGSTHRDRCIHAGETGCTILPWSGHWVSSQAGWGFLSRNGGWGP
jgi:hypothetical protein